MSEATQSISTNIWQGTIAVGTAWIPVFRVPSAATGGAITVIDAGEVIKNAVAAASAPTFELVTFGTNSAPNGTVGTLTADTAYTAGTVRTLTINTAAVQPTYWVGWKVKGTAVNADTIQAFGYITYVMGI
jgi:hypothetical protein